MENDDDIFKPVSTGDCVSFLERVEGDDHKGVFVSDGKITSDGVKALLVVTVFVAFLAFKEVVLHGFERKE